MVLENELLPFLTWLLGYPWTEPHAFLNSALFRFRADGGSCWPFLRWSSGS